MKNLTGNLTQRDVTGGMTKFISFSDWLENNNIQVNGDTNQTPEEKEAFDSAYEKYCEEWQAWEYQQENESNEQNQ